MAIGRHHPKGLVLIQQFEQTSLTVPTGGRRSCDVLKILRHKLILSPVGVKANRRRKPLCSGLRLKYPRQDLPAQFVEIDSHGCGIAGRAVFECQCVTRCTGGTKVPADHRDGIPLMSPEKLMTVR